MLSTFDSFKVNCKSGQNSSESEHIFKLL